MTTTDPTAEVNTLDETTVVTPADAPPVTLRGYAATNVGCLRENNEDAVYAGQRLFVVADGVGGQPAGEVASDLVVSVLRELDQRPASDDPLEALQARVGEANRLIAEMVRAEPHRRGMATTVTALLCGTADLGVVHVGDSRCYLLRNGQLRQLTTDHTYAQWLLEQQAITPEEALLHPQRSVITRALQGDPVEAEGVVLTPLPADRYLLCSDGLSDVVRDAAIAEVVREHPDQERCAARLIELAREAGGPDNISVVIVDAVPASAAVATPATTGSHQG